MKTIDYKAMWTVIVLMVVLAGFSLVWHGPYTALGSVMPGGEMVATTTVGMGSVHNVVAGNRVAVIGSVIVASSSATSFTIWNATSTTDTASTTIATLKASVAEGTYTFDSELPRGLVVQTPSGFNGNYTITFRSQ